MYKVGVMMMGELKKDTPTKVKQVILEVESKTQVADILQYLLELQKIKNKNVLIKLSKEEQAIDETSTISQILKETRPINGVIKLFLYQSSSTVVEEREKVKLKPSRHESVWQVKESKKRVKQQGESRQILSTKVEQVEESKLCCC